MSAPINHRNNAKHFRNKITFPESDAHDPDGSEGLLWMFDGKPETYVEFAAEYYEKKIDIEVIREIYAHKPLTSCIVTKLNPEAGWDATAKDAKEINYPIQF